MALLAGAGERRGFEDLETNESEFQTIFCVWIKGGTEARKVTPHGYFGDPTTASPERGRKEMEAYGRTAAGVIEAFLQGAIPRLKTLTRIAGFKRF